MVVIVGVTLSVEMIVLMGVGVTVFMGVDMVVAVRYTVVGVLMGMGMFMAVGVFTASYMVVMNMHRKFSFNDCRGDSRIAREWGVEGAAPYDL